MGEVILEIMSEEYRKEHCEKHTEINGRFFIQLTRYEFFIQLTRWCADAPYLMGPGHSAAAAPEPSASLSVGLFGRATVPILATLVLSHTQFLLQRA